MFLQLADVMPVSTELPALISSSAISVSIIQWMKNSNLPFLTAINQHSAGINRILSWGSAFISAIGIHHTYDANVGTLTITGLTLAAIIHAGMDATKSYAFNWLIYNGMVKPRAADIAAVAEGAPKKPTIMASPGVAAAGKELAQETDK